MDITKYTPEFKVNSKHLIGIADITEEDIYEFLYTTKLFKQKQNVGESIDTLKGKTFLLCLSKNSIKDRLSFQLAVKQLGGEFIAINQDEIDLKDDDNFKTASTIIQKLGFSAIVADGFDNELIKKFSNDSTISVVNVSSSTCSPCNAIADIYTLAENRSGFNKMKIAIVGPFNQAVNSFLIACAKCGLSVNLACPKEYGPSQKSISTAIQFSTINTFDNITDAIKGVDVVYASADNNFVYKNAEEKTRIEKQFYLDESLLSKANEDVLIMCSNPTIKIPCISPTLIDSNKSLIFNQVENRIHAVKAIYSLTTKETDNQQ